MIKVRKGEERGHFNYGWLDTYHTFSFNTYMDPEYMGFRSLRVMNEDRVEPGQGFGMHPHRDMEIVTYVLEGSLEHKDSMGNGSVLRAGEFQRMTAGTGVRHSEFNPSDTEPVHLYQIWIVPSEKGLTPGYEELRRNGGANGSGLRLVASPEGGGDGLTIHADAKVYLGRFSVGEDAELLIEPGRHAWVQALRGEVSVNSTRLDSGDGAAISGEETLAIQADRDADVMVFDLA